MGDWSLPGPEAAGYNWLNQSLVLRSTIATGNMDISNKGPLLEALRSKPFERDKTSLTSKSVGIPTDQDTQR